MRTERPAPFTQLLRLRVVSVGAIALLAIFGGARALPSGGHVPPGAVAVSDPDAASGGPQAPADAPRAARGGSRSWRAEGLGTRSRAKARDLVPTWT